MGFRARKVLGVSEKKGQGDIFASIAGAAINFRQNVRSGFGYTLSCKSFLGFSRVLARVQHGMKADIIWPSGLISCSQGVNTSLFLKPQGKFPLLNQNRKR